MATIVEFKRKNGNTAYSVRFYRDGIKKGIAFDSSYDRREVEEAAQIVERLLAGEKKGDEYYDWRARSYLENAPVDIQRRFVAAGFKLARRFVTLRDAWAEFIALKSAQNAPTTMKIWQSIGARLFSLFDGGALARSITVNDAFTARKELEKVYSEATIAITISRFRTFWTWAQTKQYVDTNVFQTIPKGRDVNRARDYQIPREWTERILDACPTQTWRTLFALWRIGGLRQQEPLRLTWSCVNWEKKRLLVYSPKTAQHAGRESRVIPLFPIIERELFASFERAPDDSPYIVWDKRQRNYERGIRRILFVAGCQPWPKLCQNMRASAENDLIEDGYPAHVVGAWLGHTAKVQERHYLRILDAYFDRATNDGDAESTATNTRPITALNDVKKG